jgi:hypothetical protein
MRWRDIRFEKPTKSDADERGLVLQLLSSGSVIAWPWDGIADVVAWMPISEMPEFKRVPDPPEGWRFVEPGDAFDVRAKFWHAPSESFIGTKITYYINSNIYIVPIEPPKPNKRYRPFNEAEATRLVGRVVRDETGCRAMITAVFRDWVHFQGNRISTQKLFQTCTFDDGSRCGVEDVKHYE